MRQANRWSVVLVFCASIFALLLVGNRAVAQTISAQPTRSACLLQNGLIIFTGNNIADCLDDSGWHEFSSDSPFNSSHASQVVLCKDNSFLFPDYQNNPSLTSEISTFDGTNLNKLPTAPEPTNNKAACGGADNIWMVGAKQDVLHFEGKAWTTYTNQAIFGKLAIAPTVTALAISPDGKTTWAASENALARFDGSVWQLFVAAKGLPQTYDFSRTQLRFDSNGALIANPKAAWLRFDGKTFKTFAYGNYAYHFYPDNKGNIWGDNIYTRGIYMFSGTRWTAYTNASVSGLINDIVVDGLGRPWVATAWGLHVFDDNHWTVFQMANSDINDNHVQRVVVLGNGPRLPELRPKKPGTVQGKITVSGKPLGNIIVELCSEHLPDGYFYRNSPCQGQADNISAKTDTNGNFTIENVPVGNYFAFAVQFKDRISWNLYGANFLMARFHDNFLVVKEGAISDLGTIDVLS